MPTVSTPPWVRVLLSALALSTLTLCSAADPELEKKLAAVQASIDAKQWDEAIAAAKALVEQSGADPRTHARLGSALLGKARHEQQQLDPQRLEQAKQANDPEAFFDPSLFKTEVAYDATLRGQAEAEMKKGLAEDAGLLEASLGLATLYAESDRFPEEKETIAAAAKAHAGEEDAGSRLLSFGERHFAAGRYDKALQIFAVLSESFPKLPAVALDYSAGLFASGKYADGIAALERAVAAHPADRKMLATLGQMYIYQSRWRQAADTFAQLVPLDPNDPLPAVHQGAALMPIEAAKAKEIFDGVVARAQGGGGTPVAIARNLVTAMTNPAVGTNDVIRLAADLGERSYPQIGVAVCAFVLARDPQNVPARLMTAFIYDNLRYYDLALARLEEARGIVGAQGAGDAGGIGPADLASHFGRVYYHMGEWRKAIDAFSMAEAPERFDLVVGISYENLGELPRAYEHLSRVAGNSALPPALVKQAQDRLALAQYAPFRQGK